MSRLSRLLPFLLLLFPYLSRAQSTEPQAAENVILITMDGFRWEEMFTGLDEELLTNAEYTEDESGLWAEFWDDDPQVRGRKLMPFFHDVIAQEGRLIGDRRKGSRVDVTNTRVFSYPGYNEILTGFADSTIDSNDKVLNRNVTVLEWLAGMPEFEGRVAAFGSWDVFPYIINAERSGIPVNAGFESVDHPSGVREAFLNELQTQIPSPWGSVRLDAFTHHFAFEHLKRDHPRVLYIAYGETDDFAHDAQYDQYIHAAHRTDAFIRDLWTWIQSTPGYKDQTTLVVTTDHGRGSAGDWIGHGTGNRWGGSEFIWMAAMGPGIPAGKGRIAEGQWYQNQVAATVAALLGLDYDADGRAGAAVEEFLDR